MIVISTGSQGEDFAALNAAANARHRDLKLSPEDLLLYSAKVRPVGLNLLEAETNCIKLIFLSPHMGDFPIHYKSIYFESPLHVE